MFIEYQKKVLNLNHCTSYELEERSIVFYVCDSEVQSFYFDKEEVARDMFILIRGHLVGGIQYLILHNN